MPSHRPGSDRIVLEQGETRTGPEDLHVDCTALGLRNAPATPIFQPGRIVLQQVRHNTPTFNAALVGFVEAHRDDDEKNELCRPNPYASSIHDWPRMMSRTWRTERRWLREPEVAPRATRPPGRAARAGRSATISDPGRRCDRAAQADRWFGQLRRGRGGASVTAARERGR